MEYIKEWRKRNLDYSKKYYHKNKKKILEYQKQYLEKKRKPRYCKVCNKRLNGTLNRSYCSNCRNGTKAYIEYKRNQINECVKKWYRKPGKREIVYAHLRRYKKEKNAYR
jgi:hypothetical protein